MFKNRLLLDQKRFLSFSNYKNYIKQALNNDNQNKFEKADKPIINIILFNQIFRNENANTRNVSLFRNKSNHIFNNNIKLLSYKKNLSKINISENISLENCKKIMMNNNRLIKNKLNISKDYFDKMNELLKKNSTRFHINKRFAQIFKDKKNSSNSFNNNISNKTINRHNSFGPSENNKPQIIKKRKSEILTTRKISKKLFNKDINGILVNKGGKKKLKYKIIGTLTTEPNHKIITKT